MATKSRRQQRQDRLRELAPRFGFKIDTTTRGARLEFTKELTLRQRKEKYQNSKTEYIEFTRLARTRTLDTLKDQERNIKRRLKKFDKKIAKMGEEQFKAQDPEYTTYKAVKKQADIIKKDIERLKAQPNVRDYGTANQTMRVLENLYTREVYSPNVAGQKSTTQSTIASWDKAIHTILSEGRKEKIKLKDGSLPTVSAKTAVDDINYDTVTALTDILNAIGEKGPTFGSEAMRRNGNPYKAVEEEYTEAVERLERNIDKVIEEDAISGFIMNDPRLYNYMHERFMDWREYEKEVKKNNK